MSKTHERRAHAEAILGRDRADGALRWRRRIQVLVVSAAVGAAVAAWFVPRAELGYGVAAGATRFTAWILHDSPIFDPEVTLTFSDGDARWGVKEWAQYRPLQATGRAVAGRLEAGAAGGLALGIAGLVLAAVWRRRAREALLADRVISGTRVVSEQALAKLTKDSRSEPHPLTIGSVVLPPGLETRHQALVATTGAGKTTVLRQMLDAIEDRGDAALVWDTSGEFIANYYDPLRGDVILNPFDSRGCYWNPFEEICHPSEADRIARYLVPETGDQDRDVWLETARILVANMLRTLRDEGRGTPEALLEALQSMPKDELQAWLGHTSSGRIFAEGADRATGSVLFMLARTANLLAFLRASPPDDGGRFSFARYFADLDAKPGPKPWVFVPRQEAYFEAVKPLMALWLDCAASATLNLVPSASRRVHFALDELADLPRVENLPRLLPEGRKFGASVVITFQAIGQMHHRYGQNRAEAMLAMCNTKLFMQMPDHQTRQWASDQIGAQEVEIQTASDSFDPRTGKPSRTLSTVRQTRPAVLESDLRLPPHVGYLLLPDGYPVAEIKLGDAHIHARGPACHPRHVPIGVEETLWSKLAAKAGEPGVKEPASPLASGPV